MKKTARIIAGAAIAIACFIAPKSVEAQQSQFSSPTWLVTNNTPLVGLPPLYTATFTVQVPAISLHIQATNANTIITNNFSLTLNTNLQPFIPQFTFVYVAATMGTNFSTNWAAFSYTTNVSLYGTAQLQGTNNTSTSTQIQ